MIPKPNKYKHRTVFRYIGGKAALAEWIISLMPNHVCYVEPFGGSAAVLFQKPISAYEIYNDLAEEVYYFFKALREESEQLQQFLKYCPASRKLIKEYAKTDPASLELVERAGRFFLLTMWSYSGKPVGGSLPVRHGFRRDGSTRAVGDGLNYMRKVDVLPFFAERLRPVVLENLDYKDLIKRYDAPNTFFYCDPPYLDVNHYMIKFSKQDHQDLSALLHEIKGKAMVSYYQHELLETLYPPENWHYASCISPVQAARGKQILIHQTQKEVLLMNYNPATDKFNSNQTTLEGFV